MDKNDEREEFEQEPNEAQRLFRALQQGIDSYYGR